MNKGHLVTIGYGEGDFAEDADHENGNYLCRCSNCQQEFIGHKRRTLCRVCHREAIFAPPSTGTNAK